VTALLLGAGEAAAPSVPGPGDAARLAWPEHIQCSSCAGNHQTWWE